MIRFLDAARTERALPFDRLIPALAAAFRDPANAPQRHRHALSATDALLLMPAWQREWLGVKIVTVHPGNAAAGHDAVHSTYVLASATTGEPAAILDGDTLTARRTAAASALAASFLAPAGASRLLLLGAGRVAALLPHAHRIVRPIERVMVWNRTPPRARALVAALRAAGFDAEVATDLPRACAEADIISAATLAATPLVEGAWLGPRTHLDLVGAFTPDMREADDAALEGAQVYADTEAALLECGELSRWSADRLAGTLATLCRAAPTGVAARTVFKSVGTAIEDLAAAVLAIGEAARMDASPAPAPWPA